MQLTPLLSILVVLVATLGCATAESPAPASKPAVSTPSASKPAVSTPSVSKPGFYTELRDGRLWVLRDGSKELAEFKKDGELARQVTRIGAGPNGMTIKSSDAEVIDAYLAAK